MTPLLGIIGTLLAMLGLGQVLGILLASAIRRRYLRGVGQGVVLFVSGWLISGGIWGSLLLAPVFIAYRLGQQSRRRVRYPGACPSAWQLAP